MKSFVLLVFAHFLVLKGFSNELSLDQIMSGNEFIGHQPEAIQWSPAGTEIFFRWQNEGELVPSYYYSYSMLSKSYRRLQPEETLYLPVDGFESKNNTSPWYFKKGSRLLRLEGKATQTIYTRHTHYYIDRVIDDRRLIIREGDNIFLVSPGEIKQLTNFHRGNKPSADVEPADFLGQQQEELFEVIQLRKKRSKARKDFSAAHRFDELSPVYAEGKTISWITINDQMTFVLYCLDKYPDDKATHVEEYVSTDGYSESKQARPKVGAEDPTHEIFAWDLVNDTVYQIIPVNLTGINEKPDFLREYETGEFNPYLDGDKKTIAHSHGFNDRGDLCLLEYKSYDNKDRWMVVYNTKTNQLIQLDHQHDAEWIGGPGISGWKGEPGNAGWINNTTVFYQSESSGYSHLYAGIIDENSPGETSSDQLTTGDFEIHDAQLSNDKTKFFITANKNHPGNREFYVLDIASKKLTPVLTADGYHEVSVSPDEKWMAVRYSSKTKPWELYIAPLKENTTMTQITKSTTEEFDAYPWRSPEVITFTADDGTTVYARVYEPAKEKDNGAGVIFVHGAGYLQNAHNWWSSYYREFMFNNLLADRGYTVMDIDYRASEGYGRDFRTDIYRHMGGKDLSDQLDGREVLITKHGCDSTRIGMYGGSYGGFITLMALLTEPGKFKCGAALRSVTDWAHYNHEYTSNILNTPEQDPVAYKRSSPIYFAEGLQDRLLMLHGMADDNVHYQDVVRLSQRFIELKKTNWDLVGYPVEPHAFVETTSWIDEYRRILELFEEELNSGGK